MNVLFTLLFLLGSTAGAEPFEASASAIVLTPSDVELAAEAVSRLAAGRGGSLIELLDERGIPLDHLERSIAVINLVVAEERIREAAAQIGQQPWPPEVLHAEAPNQERPLLTPSKEELLARLEASREDLRTVLATYLSPETSDFSLETIRAHWDMAVEIYEFFRRQERELTE